MKNIAETAFEANHNKTRIHEKEYPRPAIKICTFFPYFSDVSIIYGPGSKNNIRTISQLSAEDIGSLVVVKAIVVRSSAVKP